MNIKSTVQNKNARLLPQIRCNFLQWNSDSKNRFAFPSMYLLTHEKIRQINNSHPTMFNKLAHFLH